MHIILRSETGAEKVFDVPYVRSYFMYRQRCWALQMSGTWDGQANPLYREAPIAELTDEQLVLPRLTPPAPATVLADPDDVIID